MAEPQDTEGMVRGALEAFNSGDTEAFLGRFSDDMRFRMNGTHGFSNPCASKAEFVDLVGRVVAGLSEMIQLEVESFHVAGEWVICEAAGRAKTTAGEPYLNSYCMLWHVRDGKIVELKEYNDSALIERMFFPEGR
ncbi:MAG: hypothetical protein FJ144_10775 [Deltaproteobacteria bacterium]|nr:hypothetical protein [Deltaproteobacteria bacterium]